jgi:hypothetical protein
MQYWKSKQLETTIMLGSLRKIIPAIKKELVNIYQTIYAACLLSLFTALYLLDYNLLIAASILVFANRLSAGAT